jgi:hypothetical protein
MNKTIPNTKHSTVAAPLLFAGAAAYVALVLSLDTFGLARARFANGFDLFKFVAWFVVPFLICLPRMDWGALGIRGLRRVDWIIFGIALGLGALSILVVPLVPTLKSAFPHVPAQYKWAYFSRMAIYNVSWVTGWEFMHRYFLLRTASKVSSRFGWLVVPLSETVYHLAWWPAWQMPAGMLIFSLIATRWSLSRKNVLLPFLVHFGIETELALFQIIG